MDMSRPAPIDLRFIVQVAARPVLQSCFDLLSEGFPEVAFIGADAKNASCVAQGEFVTELEAE